MENRLNQVLSNILGRSKSFLHEDMEQSHSEVADTLKNARALVIGAAGSTGSSFVTELAKFGLMVCLCLMLAKNPGVILVSGQSIAGQEVSWA
ncbi:hypothetical protein N9733_05910 [Akkermansiaceae bacterium]|nr:hypothetical protein [bacterium]MDB4142979.1 hypothetical protein [Akkermansiaceae bacterium]